MLSENAIDVKNISKKFKVYYDKGTTLKEKVLFKKRRKFEERVVLDNISFSVRKGEAIGLIGHNGCGKSTTLKLLTRIMYPDSGSIVIQGRVSSLIELGAGFHPDMTGRENIYTNASIFGLTRKEIDDRLDEIIRFSELEEYIDNPVRTYSSGMYMRLAFSVAINVDADILLIDEILTVGDASFQAKCFQKLKEIKKLGTTIVIVSHSLGQIEQICEKTIWINEGKIKLEGEPREVHPQYLEYISRKDIEKAEKKDELPCEDKKNDDAVQESGLTKIEDTEVGQSEELFESNSRYGNMNIKITEIEIINGQNIKTDQLLAGEAFKIRIHYQVKKEHEDIVFGVGFWNEEGKNCYGTNTLIDHISGLKIDRDGVVEFNSDYMVFLEGKYTLQVAITDSNMLPIDYWNDAYYFQVRNAMGDIGMSRLPHQWYV